MCIDWEQLDTGNCHQNADLQKVEQAVVKSTRPRQYGFVDAVPPAALETRQTQQLRKDCGIPAWTFVSPGELSPHSTRLDKAALHHVERCEKDWTTLAEQPPPEHKQMFTKHLHTCRPSLQLFATGAKLLQKGAKVKIFPCVTTNSISSQFTGVSLCK